MGSDLLAQHRPPDRTDRQPRRSLPRRRGTAAAPPHDVRVEGVDREGARSDARAERRGGPCVWGARWPRGRCLLRADRDRIAQVLISLVENGSSSARREGPLRSRSATRAADSPTQVRDTAPASRQEGSTGCSSAITAPPMRSRQGSGRRQGLAICRQILRMHGCTIRASNAEGAERCSASPCPSRAAGKGPIPTRRCVAEPPRLRRAEAGRRIAGRHSSAGDH